MCVIDSDRDGKRKRSSKDENLELVLGDDLQLSVLDSYLLNVPGFSMVSVLAALAAVGNAIKFQMATSGKPVSQQMWLSSQSVLVSCQHSKLSPHQIVPTSSSLGCCYMLPPLPRKCSLSFSTWSSPAFTEAHFNVSEEVGILQLLSEENC